MENEARRKFVKYGIATLGAFIASAAVVSIDKAAGFKVGDHTLNVGMSEANATCGAGMDCSGGGGQCGAGMNCGGGGGKCGAGMNCSGGGGQCGAGMNCAGS